MEKKKMYVAPLTKKTVVELESGFMGASMQGKDIKPESSTVNSYNQEITNNGEVFNFNDPNDWK